MGGRAFTGPACCKEDPFVPSGKSVPSVALAIGSRGDLSSCKGKG